MAVRCLWDGECWCKLPSRTSKHGPLGGKTRWEDADKDGETYVKQDSKSCGCIERDAGSWMK